MGKNHPPRSTTLQLLPLHLACALDPPDTVIQLFLDLYVDAAALPIRPSHQRRHRRRAVLEKSQSLTHGRWKIRKRYQEWRRTRSGAFPVSDDRMIIEHDDPQQSLLSEDNGTVFWSAAASEDTNDPAAIITTDDDGYDEEHSRSSNGSKNIILQLSPSGGLRPMLLKSFESEDTMSSSTTVFRVHWDLDPLLEHVMQYGDFWALHVACIYSAKPNVLHRIARAYPPATLVEVVGMLPIHLVCSGWMVPPLLQPIDATAAVESTADILEALQVLKQVVPDSVYVRSGNHGMTPVEYLNEFMEDCQYREACIQILLSSSSSDQTDPIDEVASLSSHETVIFSATDSSSRSSGVGPSIAETISCVTTLVTQSDWRGLQEALEEDPTIASRWVFGLDKDPVSHKPCVWKRLPIHLACAQDHVPVELIDQLLRAYPEGAIAADPLDGSTPLHLVCRLGVMANVDIVRTILRYCPEASQKSNRKGQLPIHQAISSTVPHSITECLVEHNPATIAVADKAGMTPVDVAKMISGESSDVYEILTVVERFLNHPSTMSPD